MTKHCLICERAIGADDIAVHDATVWRSDGNFGSKVYDSLAGDVFLEAFVCDDCLLKKKELVEEVIVQRTTKVVERRLPDFRQAPNPT